MIEFNGLQFNEEQSTKQSKFRRFVSVKFLDVYGYFVSIVVDKPTCQDKTYHIYLENDGNLEEIYIVNHNKVSCRADLNYVTLVLTEDDVKDLIKLLNK